MIDLGIPAVVRVVPMEEVEYTLWISIWMCVHVEVDSHRRLITPDQSSLHLRVAWPAIDPIFEVIVGKN
jgi:hypothetical protein